MLQSLTVKALLLVAASSAVAVVQLADDRRSQTLSARTRRSVSPDSSRQQDLGLFQRPRSPVFNVPPGDELTMRQLYDCLAELADACRSGGYLDLLKVDTAGKSPRDWQAEPRLLEQLRLKLFKAHRQDQPDERLALCFIIKTPDIFDQSRPRQDPVCLHLANGQFRMETEILRAQKTLCRSSDDSPSVHYLCRRPAASALLNVTNSRQPSSFPEATATTESWIHRRSSSFSSSSKTTERRSGGLSREAEERLKCALVWIVGVLLALVIVLVAGILAHTLLHRQSHALAPAPPHCYANDKTSLMEENGRCVNGAGGGIGGIDGGSGGLGECVL